MTPEQAAEHILKAAGSRLDLYKPENRAAILKAAAEIVGERRKRRLSRWTRKAPRS